MAFRTPSIQLGKASVGAQCILPGSLAVRSLSTTIATRADRPPPPPESPAYIPLPAEPFSDETKLDRVRGSLPVPRKVFPHPRDKHKLSPKYLEETYPRSPKEVPQSELVPGSKKEWRRIMADARRQNLAVGLSGLWQRHVRTERLERLTKQRKHDEYLAAGRAPLPDHDRYTKSSVLSATLHARVYPDPQRFEKAEASRQRTQALAEEKRLARRDAIMELYLNADSFIIDERELAGEIDRVFDDSFWKRPGLKNAWAQYGRRPSLDDMLSDMVRFGKLNNLLHTPTDFNRNVRRQKAVAEELTGGKLDPSINDDKPAP